MKAKTFERKFDEGKDIPAAQAPVNSNVSC